MTSEEELLARTSTWFPWLQRAIVLVLGAGGFVYATLAHYPEAYGAAGPLLIWQGYQELKRADAKVQADSAEPGERKPYGEDGWDGL